MTCRSAGWAAMLLTPALFAFLLPAGRLVAAQPLATPRPFVPGKVLPVHVTLSAAEFDAIQPRGGLGFLVFGTQAAGREADPKRKSHRNDFGMDLPLGTGTVAIAGRVFEKVGIRYKGNGTIMDASRGIKKSFKIDLGDERFWGAKKVNLHCGVSDPSKLRETLGYQLYRDAGVPAPRTALAEVRLTVPGKYDKELLGLFTIVEEVDRPFLRDHFGDGKGLLMKPKGLRNIKDLGDDWDRYKKSYVPRRAASAEAAKRVIAFARFVDKADDAEFAKSIGSHLDVDGYLRFLATTAFVANIDSIFIVGHNCYLYLHPVTGKIHFIPWDLDRAFANWGNANQNMDLSLTHPYGGTHKLTERLLEIPEVAAKYQKLLKELAAGPFAKARLSKELAGLEKVVKELREREAKALAGRKERAPSEKPPALADFIEKRTESVSAQLEGKRTGYVPRPFGFFGFGRPAEPKKGKK